ncbi:hypothetical protein E1263_17190 [Kribbella antibiotica]|uniref:Uncharacterized protein n=1 Tax=Kribbella antibiotica TaxID=190195 RepID=A0A4R4ZJI6_9ACTN|nr:hypothetical protein [Kribbella antibiotica]TDD58918.1 hypothetical protein E1263_17190 [Kribbella antibiotica]
MPGYVFLAVLGVGCGCALIGWLAWLRFNERMYDKSQTLEVFDHTSQVARSYLEALVRRPPGARVIGGLRRAGRREQEVAGEKVEIFDSAEAKTVGPSVGFGDEQDAITRIGSDPADALPDSGLVRGDELHIRG